ncbi:hypothetical protein, partial [Escherichia coli]|uniref:hypothetical protein n=1 Tax=Escherichia coli TaxID=562 RepID=UPI001BFE427F
SPDYRPDPAAGCLSTASHCSSLNASQTPIKIRIRSPLSTVHQKQDAISERYFRQMLNLCGPFWGSDLEIVDTTD